MKLWSKEARVLGGMYGVLETPFSLNCILSGCDWLDPLSYDYYRFCDDKQLSDFRLY